MKKSQNSKLSFLNRIQIKLFKSISYTNSRDSINNKFIRYSLIFSYLQIMAFLLNQINSNVDSENETDNYTDSNPNEQYLTKIFKIITNVLQAIYTPMLFDDIKILYFIIAYMILQLIIFAVAISIKYPTIHRLFSYFILYHSHIFAFFIHNISIGYAFNNKLYNNISNSSNFYTQPYNLTLTLKIILIFLNFLSLLLCFYYDLFYYNNTKHYILTKFSNIVNSLYHFSRIIIVIIAYITYTNQNIRGIANNVFMMLICIIQLYLLIKYNIFIFYKTIQLHIILYMIIFFISLISLLSSLYDYNIYIIISILVIIPLACKIITQYTLYLYLNRLCKNIEMLQNEWECLAHYYSIQHNICSSSSSLSYTFHKSKFTIDSNLRKIILNGLMANYYKIKNHDIICNSNNLRKIRSHTEHNKPNNLVYSRDQLNDFSHMLLEIYIKKFPTSHLIKFQLIENLIIDYKLYNKALLMIESMIFNHKKFNLKKKFVIFGLRKMIMKMLNSKSSRSNMNNYEGEIFNLMKFLDYMKEFNQLFNMQLTNTIKFWQELLKPEIQLINVYNNAQNIFTLNKTIQTLWLKIDNACQKKISKPYLLYSLYNYVLINLKDTGDKSQEIYKKIIDMKIIVECKLKECIYNNYTNNNGIDILSQNNIYFMISGEKRNLGMVINCSDNIMPILGYNKDQIIKHNIDIIIPPIHRKYHHGYWTKYINNIYKTLYDHSLEMYFVNKDNDLCTCEINLKDLYHETHGMIFFVLIQPINHDNDFMLIHDNGIIDCMSQNLKEEIGFLEKNIPKNIHIDSICISLVNVGEFFRQKSIRDDHLLENNKFLNGYIIQLITPNESNFPIDYNNTNNIPVNYYLCYIENRIIREELVIRKATLKKLVNKNLDLVLLEQYKASKSKFSLCKSEINQNLNDDDIPNEESIDDGLLRILDSKVETEIMPKKFILKDNVGVTEESKSLLNCKNFPSEKNPLINMFSDLTITNIQNFSNYNPFSIQEQTPKISNLSPIIENKTESKLGHIIMKTYINSPSKADAPDLSRNFIRESFDLREFENINKNKSQNNEKNPKIQAQETMITIMEKDSKTMLDYHDKPSQPFQGFHISQIPSQSNSFEGKLNLKDKKEEVLSKPLKKRNPIGNFESNQDLSSGGYEYQKFIQKALKIKYFLKDVHLMKIFIYLCLILNLIIIFLEIFYQISSIDAAKASKAVLEKNYHTIDNLLDIRFYARLLAIVDAGLMPINRHKKMNITNYHDFCLFRLNRIQIHLNQANSDFLDFLYGNIDQKYRDEITLTQINVHWDIEDNDINYHGYGFSEQMYSLSNIVSLIIHQTFMLVHSNLTIYNLQNPQLNFVLNNIGGAFLIYSSKNSDIFRQALIEYLNIYLSIEVSLFCLGCIVIIISWNIFGYIMYKLYTEKIKILKIFSLIRPEEIKIALERFCYLDNVLKINDAQMENIDKYLDQLFTIESTKDKNSFKQRKRIKANIISKQITRSYISLFLKLSLLIGILGIYYLLNIKTFINFEEQNKLLIHKLEFLNDHMHTLVLSLSLTYQFLQKNATGFAYHEYPNAGNITTLLDIELQKQKKLMNLLGELSGINSDIDYLLSDNICGVNTKISETECLKLADGAMDLGLVGISSYIYKSLNDVYNNFLSSNRTTLAIEEMLDDKNLKDIEIMTMFYLNQLYNRILSILDELFNNEVDYIINSAKITTSIFTTWLALITVFILLPMQRQLEDENKGLKKLLTLIPYFIYHSNKYLEQKLLKMAPGINFTSRIQIMQKIQIIKRIRVLQIKVKYSKKEEFQSSSHGLILQSESLNSFEYHIDSQEEMDFPTRIQLLFNK